MATTFARIRESVGRELQPVGAQFQEIFARFFEENEEAIVEFAKNLAFAAKAIADNSKLIAESLKALLGFGAIAAAIPIATSVAAAFTKVTAAIKGMSAAMLAVPGFGWVAAGVVALGLLGKAVYDNNEAFRNFVNNITNIFASDFKRAADDMADAARASANRIREAYEEQVSKLQSIAQFISNIFKNAFKDTSVSAEKSAAASSNAFGDFFKNLSTQAAAGFDGLNSVINSWWSKLPAPIRRLFEGQVAGILTGGASYLGGAVNRAANAPSTGMFDRFDAWKSETLGAAGSGDRPSAFRFPGGDIDGGGAAGGKAAKGPESRAAELQLDLHLREQMLEAESMIAQARLDGDERLVAMLTTLQAQTRLVTEAAKVELDKIPAQDKALRLRILEQDSLQESSRLTFALAELEKKATEELRKSMEQISKQVDEFKNRAAFEREYGELIMQGTLPATARQYLETKRVVEETLRAAEAALAKAEADGASADEIERQRKELERIRGAGQEELGRVQGGDDPSAVISGAITQVKGELNELLNLGNQIVNAANAIGDAFGNSFKGLVSGSMSAKEALRSFFQSTADYFLDMAAKIIAKQIQIFILQTALGFIGGALGGGGGGLGQKAQGISFNPKAFSMPRLAADGATFSNGIAKFAKGGVVNRPTMFKFANGGAMQNGVMGEAGPEAIMPLKRGADGKLGVAARMDGAIARYRRPPGTMAAAADDMAATEGAAPAAVNGAIDVRYTVERINSVDYVTADQFQRGMQQAATQGAQRGEQQALRQLQQNTAVRGRVGLR
jgi:lambda family phage tail tape measure protein